VIAAFLAQVMVLPVLLAYVLGIAFSLDPSVLGDTWRVVAAALAFSAIVVVSAGTLMLAISSLSRNSRVVGVIWIGVWVLSGVASTLLYQAIQKDWCPLISYTANLTRVRDGLLDSESAWQKATTLFQASRDKMGGMSAGRGPSGRRGRGVGFTFGLSPRRAPLAPGPPEPSEPPVPDGQPPDVPRALTASYPWQWSAGVLAGLAVLSLWVLTTRVRSLDRLR
jgi:ABC-2 type transport system permease protein